MCTGLSATVIKNVFSDTKFLCHLDYQGLVFIAWCVVLEDTWL